VAATTSTTLSTFIQNVVGRAVQDEIAQHLFWPGAPASKYIKMRDMTQVAGLTASFPKYNTLTAYDLTEGADFNSTQALTPTATTITMTEHGVQTLITELSQRGIQDPNAKAQYAQDVVTAHLRAIMTKYDKDIMTLFASLDAGYTNTGVNITEANILYTIDLAAKANMPKPWGLFLHPQQWSDLISETGTPFKDVSASGTKAQEIYNSYYMGEVYGAEIYVSNNVPTANAAADRGGALLSPEALGVVWGMMPDTRTSTEDQSLRADEILTIAHYGVGEVDGTMGMYVITDA
jgi:hypothetical protein